MFWTAFIWGLGVSCGGSIGVLAYVCAFWILQWAAGKTADRAALVEHQVKSLEALLVRNELSREQVEYLSDIAAAMKDDYTTPATSTDE